MLATVFFLVSFGVMHVTWRSGS